jgi:hypothetical protein
MESSNGARAPLLPGGGQALLLRLFVDEILQALNLPSCVYLSLGPMNKPTTHESLLFSANENDTPCPRLAAHQSPLLILR